MDRQVFITGIGVVFPGAVSCEALVDVFRRSESMLRPDVQSQGFMGARVEAADPHKRIPIGKRRRLNRIGMFSVVAALEALADAGLEKQDLALDRTGIVVGTGLGCSATVGSLYREVLQLGPANADPALFPTGVPNAVASQVALVLSLGGPNITVSQREVSGEVALAVGAEWIRHGRADRVLVGGADEVTDHMVNYLTSLSIVAPPGGQVRPFGEESQGAGIGEGAVFLLLEADPGARPARARIQAWANFAVPVEASSLDAEGTGLSRAVTDCLRVSAENPVLIVASANGHRATDLAHQRGLSACRGTAGATITSIKGIFGESLSTGVAAAAVGAACVADGAVLLAGTAHGGAALALMLVGP